MRTIIFAFLAFMVFVTQAMAFNWISGGGAKDTKANRVLAQSAIAASVTGTTSETTLATYTLPANVLGNNGALRVVWLVTTTNSANNKTLRMKFGNNSLHTSVLTTSTGARYQTDVRNRGTTDSQLSFGTGIYGASAGTLPTTSAISTTAPVVITITGQLANTGETITLEGYTIELLPGN